MHGRELLLFGCGGVKEYWGGVSLRDGGRGSEREGGPE